MFDIDNYNAYVLYAIFPIIISMLFYVFRKRLFLFFDPLGMQLIWISSYFVLAILMLSQDGFQTAMCILFIMINLYYLAWLWFFLKPLNIPRDPTLLDMRQKYEVNRRIIGVAYWLITGAYFVSQTPFFRYALEVGSLLELPFYRYIALQGGEPLFRSLQTGIFPFFIYFSFVRIFFLEGVKKITWLFLLLVILLSAIGGGRSVFLIIFLYGCAFVFSHRDSIAEASIGRINRITPVILFFVIAAAMTISSFYENEGSGILNIINRIPATADGIEYYTKYNGYENVSSGLWDFIQGVFGLYIKAFAGEGYAYKNIGQQLAELASGGDLQFAQGPNFSLSLQVMVLGFYWFPIYLILLAYLCAKMRNFETGDFRTKPLQFLMSINAFLLPSDIEYGIFVMLCGLLIYFLMIRPVFVLRRLF